ncbi:MAG TPA: serine hydrolase [Acidimicrobiales bacterium]|nr:serine hydrolase [Acidimicrobiales bacterium]
MSDDAIPSLSPRFVSQPRGVPWPDEDWPRATSAHDVELSTLVDELLAHEALGATNAVLIIQGGQLLVERYAGVQEFFDRPPEPIDATSPLLSWSMAKSMLHFVVGTLVDEGRLTLDQSAIAPEWRAEGDPRGAITLADLLAMRDGLDFAENYVLGEHSDVIDMLFGDGKTDVARYAAARPLAHPPSSFFNYSSGTSNIISRLVADTVGYADAYRAFLHERLFDPLSMRSAVATFDEAGVFIASSYVHATALDFAKFGLLYLRGGEWNGRQLVSREWTFDAQRPLSRDDENGHYYSRQWWVSADPYGTYWASGYEGQMISVVPALDALVVRFGHTDAAQYPALYAWRRRVLDVLAKS